MSPEEITAAANALATATQQSAVASGQDVEHRQAELAPGLNTGSNEPGGYNYQRNVSPVVDPLVTGLVANAKQAVLRGALKDATYTANSAYVDAQSNYQARQRAFQVKQAEAARERQRKSDAASAAVLAAQLGSNTRGGGIGDVDVSENDKKFIGNNDVRGRLSYLASQGDNNAKIALQYVGNDNKYSLSPSDPRYKQVIGALNAIGASNVYKAPAAKPAPVVNNAFGGGTFRLDTLTSGGYNPLFKK